MKNWYVFLCLGWGWQSVLPTQSSPTLAPGYADSLIKWHQRARNRSVPFVAYCSNSVMCMLVDKDCFVSRAFGFTIVQMRKPRPRWEKWHQKIKDKERPLCHLYSVCLTVLATLFIAVSETTHTLRKGGHICFGLWFEREQSGREGMAAGVAWQLVIVVPWTQLITSPWIRNQKDWWNQGRAITHKCLLQWHISFR